jgi:hypothetical protein
MATFYCAKHLKLNMILGHCSTWRCYCSCRQILERQHLFNTSNSSLLLTRLEGLQILIDKQFPPSPYKAFHVSQADVQHLLFTLRSNKYPVSVQVFSEVHRQYYRVVSLELGKHVFQLLVE